MVPATGPPSNPEVPDPFQSFEAAGFPQHISRVLAHARYPAPSVIQAQAWPVAQEGRDLVAIASTGSGKTLAYLLPALTHIQARGGDPALGPTVLVLAPTRELAKQIEDEARRFAIHWPADPSAAGAARPSFGRHAAHGPRAGLRTACLYGGASRGMQSGMLHRQPQMVIATPGRLLDFIESGELPLGQVTYLVLDEADRMLDMGFEPQLLAIARELPAGRQTLFFSATWPRDVQQAARRMTSQEPVTVFIGDVQAKPVAATTITQRVHIVPPGSDKFEALKTYLEERDLSQLALLQQGQQAQRGGAGFGGATKVAPLRVMVFTSTKSGADMLAHRINESTALRAASIHGDKAQSAREYALAKFKSGAVPVLVATDVAARGLDIPDVQAVVNFDFPNDTDMYVHRIGRTGRGGALGESLTLLTRRDADAVPSLVAVMEGAGQEVPQELRDMMPRRGSGGGGAGGFSRGGRGGGFGRRPWERRGSGSGYGQQRGGAAGGRREDRDGDDGGFDGDAEPRRHHHHADSSDWRGGFGRDKPSWGSGGGGQRGRERSARW